MAYCIMRCAKLSSFGSVGGSLKHCFRERDTPNADESKTHDNTHFYAKNTEDAFRLLRERLATQEKIRKNAVLAVEYVFTASPEFFETASSKERAQFFEQSLDWLKEKYGDKNIFVATVHEDEKTPHLSAFVVPIDEKGKLNARGLIGNREQMSKDQDTFYEKVKNLGLERGVKGSKAQHQTIQQYYSELKKATEDIELLSIEDVRRQKTGFMQKETEEERLERLNVLISHRTRQIRSKSHEYDEVRGNMLSKLRDAEKRKFDAIQAKRTAEELQEKAKGIIDQKDVIAKQQQQIDLLKASNKSYHEASVMHGETKRENERLKKGLKQFEKIGELAKKYGVKTIEEIEQAFAIRRKILEEQKRQNKSKSSRER